MEGSILVRKKVLTELLNWLFLLAFIVASLIIAIVLLIA